ncbi:MAG: hypothetical protein A2140_04740 [Candidatus Muproteobacteria bacterium RBG_16_62_13]|uniref:YknX-like C-terminal permuted SH3-like domain-containing protein n=1 Tax=Candidatus Muproteobacteria bacterium RBG_16_62_13 TaxID=1817756 RepID=A0A1F6SWM9_9PROT|nr:MAG: hypothetical protein A2140_04740 [Candidatus Muproteobacteria bacterium RBG_16_62_13]
MIRSGFIVVVLLSLLTAGCGADNKKRPPSFTNVTTAISTTKDLAVVESAVGMESAVGDALHYDPTSLRAQPYTIRLPFPDHVARQLRPGQSVILEAFGEPGKKAAGRIREIRPALNSTTLTRDVIVTVATRGWRPLGSIRGEVVLGVRRKAVVVPEQAVVLRPAGSVVYRLEGEQAREVKVATGMVREGEIEITEGLAPGVTVVVDGAALLSEGARVQIRTERRTAPDAAPPAAPAPSKAP